MKILLAIFSFIIGIILFSSSDLSAWEIISLCMLVYFFTEFLDNLGRKIIILDLIVVMAIFTCLVMPVVFYHEYTRENLLARLWVKYMPLSSNDYFSFAVPSVFFLIFGLRVPLGKQRNNKKPDEYIQNVKKYVFLKPKLGLILIGVGVTSGLLDFISPGSLKQVFYLSEHLTYVGVFYVLYSPNRYKRVIIPSVLVLMIGQTVVTGMFGDFIFMLALSVILIFLGTKIPLYKKIIFAVAGVFFILIIQSIKSDYRKRNWLEGTGADPAYFAELIGDRIADPSSLFDPNAMFFTAVRMNQGWLVAVTMNKVPTSFPFANGETIWQSVAASFVPRFLWPDKPEAGGRANLMRFWGFDVHGYSMGLGPLGEGYANFDRFGGVIYMFFYGLFFNFVLSMILKFSDKRPSLILWLPFLFFYAVVLETDLVTTMNSLVKGVFFTWIVFRFFRIAFRIDL
jgi:hypothetical protein